MSALRRNYLSGLENVAQAIGTMGPTATLGTVIPLLIGKSGNATWLLFIGVLIIFVLITVSINVFASVHASSGSLATFTEMGLGPWPGILAGWSYLVAMVFVVASSAVSSAYYVTLAMAHFSHRPMGLAGSMLLMALIVLLAWWPAHRDVKLSTKVMLGVEAVSVATIVFILGVAMVRTGHWVDRPQLRLEGADLSHVRLGFVLAFMMLSGFESVTTLGEEARTATRTLPRVMLTCLLPIGLLFLGSTYALAALSHYRTLALDQTDAPFDLIAQSIGLPSLGWLSSVGVALSCFGCALGAFNAGARVVYWMACNGKFWPAFGAIHRRNATPHRALALLALVAVVVPAVLLWNGVKLADAMDYLMQLASFGFIGAYFAVCAAAPVYLARRGKLGFKAAVIAGITLSAIGAVLVLSVFPIPDPPWRYLPFIFAGLLALGVLITLFRPGRGGSPTHRFESPETADCAWPTGDTPADRCPTSRPG